MELPSHDSKRRVAAGFSNHAQLTQASQSQSLCSRQLRKAFALLKQAHEYAVDAKRDSWEFAVELPLLRRLGLTTLDFRWLVCKGYVEHAREVSERGDAERSFRHKDLTFSKRSCFVLTRDGLEFSLSLLDAEEGSDIDVEEEVEMNGDDAQITPIHIVRPKPAAKSAQVPHWDCDFREIIFGDKVVKQFKLPSPNQEAILMAFEEEGWPSRIDDPLPQTPKRDPKQRLHDTIRSLNRNQKHRLVRFMGDGTGQGILWEPIQEGDESDPSD